MTLTSTVEDPAIDALRDAGVFRLLAPADIGGAETDPLTFLRVVEESAYTCGEAGWCVATAGGYAIFGGMLPRAGALRIFGAPGGLVAGSFRPDGIAVEVEGGYRVSGRWLLDRGSACADWLVGGCVVVRNGEPVIGSSGAPAVREVFFPAEVSDLIAAEYAIDDVFVPAEQTTWFQDPPRCDRPLYHMPPIALFAGFVAGVAMGVARHAIDETAPPPGRHRAQAEAMVAAGRRRLVAVLDELWTEVVHGHRPTLADRGVLWLAATHAAHSARAAIELIGAAGGAGPTLARCLRDARSAAAHIGAQELNFEPAGRPGYGPAAVPKAWVIDSRNMV